jgi:LysR family transcriptional regulator, hypochlorite-specific transcription factor HypT
MRLDWLEDMLAVVETGSFSDAAARRGLTQSAFSRRIRTIEDHVGTELFDRTRKPVQFRPGTAGHHDRILRLATALRQLRADLRHSGGQAANRIVIAGQHALSTSLTPDLIRRIEVLQGGIFIRLKSANLDECFALLLSRQADIALVYRLPGEDHPVAADYAADYIETVTIGPDRLIPVRSSLSIEPPTGAEVPYIAFPPDVFLGKVMERHILPQIPDFVRYVARVETALTHAAMELAVGGLGIAWVPASLAGPRIRSGQLTDLSDALPGCALAVTAVRLRGQPTPAEADVWAALSNRPVA